MTLWVLEDAAGKLIRTVEGGADELLRYAGTFANAVAVSRRGDPQTEFWSGGGWQTDLAKLEPLLIAPIKQEAERRRMLVLSPGAGKNREYEQKRREVNASAGVLGAVLNALTTDNAMGQYPAATMESKRTGEPLATVLTRIRTRADAVDREVLRLSAIEAAAVAAIKAAATGAAKRQTAGAVNWDWQP